MNIKKLFATLAGVSLFAQSVIVAPAAFAANYGEELEGAYKWAYENGITTMPTIDDANMLAPITRAEMAKMLANWAMNVKGKTPNTSATCTFTDTASVKGDLAQAIIDSCQLGLMGQGISEFRPYDTITRAEFGTALSRALYGNKYEGGNPYYANHLNALKADGIMNQIANAESMKEVRGYVMLMLQRSEEGTSKVDCDDAAIAVACALDSDKCPAECKEDSNKDDEKEDTVVKSGDLLIKATPSTNRRAVVDGISDLDTITLKASEAITLNSVTLERYGYSDGANVIWVWLENADGKEITNHKTLSKDKVTLAIKKDYKELESTDEFTIVVELANAKAGGTIGFKVTEADASAKNLDLSDYDPYTYDLVDYDWAKVTLTQKGKADTYNYEKGESYEVQRFKAKSEAAAISVYGFTLKNEGSVDLQDGVADVTVTVNDEKVKGLKWSINNKDELQINFDEVELAIRETSIFAVNVELVDGFEDLNNDIQLSLAKSDFNAAEKKTGSRVDVDTAAGVTIALPGYSYLIRWGKIELTNTKLGTVEAAADTDDVVFGKWEITIGGEAIVLNPFSLTFASDAVSAKAITAATDAEGKYSPIKNVRIMVNGDEISATCTSTITTAWTGVAPAPYTAKYSTVCDFDKTIDVDKDGEIEFLANVSQYAAANKTISVTPTTYGKATILATSAKIGKYDNANEEIQSSDFIGTIDLNDIKVQTPKAALENTKSKTVEFVQGKSDTQTIFEWKYTAKKKDVYLNSFTATANLTNAQVDAAGDSIFDELSLNIRVDGKKVATTDVKWLDTTTLTATQDFTKVLVAAGESVDVKVEAHAYPTEKTTENIEFSIAFAGEDKDGNEAGSADDVAAQIKAVEKGSLSVSDSAYQESKDFRNNSVSLKKSNATIAKFDLKPSKSSTSVDLDEFVFTVTPASTAVKVKVGTNTTPTMDCASTPGTCYVTELDETVESNGITVEISTKGNAAVNEYTVVLQSVNDNANTTATSKLKEYTQLIMPVLVTFDQKDMGWTTKITASMDQWDNEVEINKIEFSIDSGSTYLTWAITNISESSKWEVEFAWDDAWVKLIDALKITTDEAAADCTYGTSTTAGCEYVILKSKFNDYFRVGDTYLKIFKA